MEPTNVPLAEVIANASNATVATQQAAHDTAATMVAAHIPVIQQRAAELQANNNVVPDAWLPFLNAIKFACDIVLIWAGPVLKGICEVILAAIAAVEQDS